MKPCRAVLVLNYEEPKVLRSLGNQSLGNTQSNKVYLLNPKYKLLVPITGLMMAEAATTNLAVAAIQEYRLVIAIDYGTTYTGKFLLLSTLSTH